MNATATVTAAAGARKVTREELTLIEPPEGTNSHRPIKHELVVSKIEESLRLRNIAVVGQQFAVSNDGMKLFGALILNHEYTGVQMALGLRNSNDKSLTLGLTVGYEVKVCSNLMFKGDFTPLQAKHTKNFELDDALAIGIERMHKGFIPLQESIDAWTSCELTDDRAKTVLYDAFAGRHSFLPPKLLKLAHGAYFNPEPAFESRTFWSLSNALTESAKALNPTQFYQQTAKIGGYLSNQFKALPPWTEH